MAYDIHGNPLKRGHCEVHPFVNHEFPCSLCEHERREYERTRDEADNPSTTREQDLEAALRDMLAGWKYIREFHGDLYGVGWDRCEAAAEAALKRAALREGR